MEQGEQGKRESQSDEGDGATGAFKMKTRHLNQLVKMSKKKKQWQV